MKYKVFFELDFRRNPYKGLYIALEGIDGSGKTTQVSKVVKKLQEKTLNVLETKEPTEGLIGAFIRKALSSKITISPISFQYLFVADRVEHQKEVEEYLKKGYIVISDRSLWSSVPYGMIDRGADFSNGDSLLTAFSILSFYNQFIAPDTTFFLDISVDEAIRRLSQMDKTKELYERREKLEKIADGYNWLIKKFGEEFTVVDGEKPIEQVTNDIIKLLKLPK